MSVTLIGIPASHAVLTAQLMLRHKRVTHRRIDLIPAAHKPIVRALGFPGKTVPAVFLGGRRVQGNAQIASALDELVPEPPLRPRDPGERAAVEEAERWADSELQDIPRRLAWWALVRDMSPLSGLSRDARLGMPVAFAVRTAGPFVHMARRLNRATDEAMRADLAALPGVLDRIDALVEAGTVGGERPNVADFQIAASVRLLLVFDDLRPAIEPRAAGRIALRLAPDFPGRIPPVLPADALAPLSLAAA